MKEVFPMDMNRAYFKRKEDRSPRWRLIDAKGKVVGRLATEIADVLRGKNRPDYTQHTDTGDYVVVINVDKIVFTGDKMRDKEYVWYTRWIGGLKTLRAEEMLKRDPARILEHAVKGMLAHTKMARAQLLKLKIYAGDAHPHRAQITGFAEEAPRVKRA